MYRGYIKAWALGKLTGFEQIDLLWVWFFPPGLTIWRNVFFFETRSVQKVLPTAKTSSSPAKNVLNKTPRGVYNLFACKIHYILHCTFEGSCKISVTSAFFLCRLICSQRVLAVMKSSTILMLTPLRQYLKLTQQVCKFVTFNYQWEVFLKLSFVL